MKIEIQDRYSNEKYAVDNLVNSSDACQNQGILKLIKPVNILNTGHVERFFKVSENYIVVEDVFVGRKKSFLQSVTIYTRLGQLVKSRFSIRDTEYSSAASYEDVTNSIKAFNKNNPLSNDDYYRLNFHQLYPTEEHMNFTIFHIQSMIVDNIFG